MRAWVLVLSMLLVHCTNLDGVLTREQRDAAAGCACTPSATEACASGGERTCAESCQWGDCVQPTCGDGVITAPEKCDGTTLPSGTTCTSVDSARFSSVNNGGTLKCASNCAGFDTSACCQRHAKTTCVGNESTTRAPATTKKTLVRDAATMAATR